MTYLSASFSFLSRFLLVLVFIISGFGKILNYELTEQYMLGYEIVPFLLPLVIFIELVFPILIIVGYFARFSAFILICFTIMASVIFHFDFSDQMQQIMLVKNIAIIGGLSFLIANGPGKASIDNHL